MAKGWLVQNLKHLNTSFGAIYTTAWAGLTLIYSGAGRRLVHLHLRSRPDWNMKLDLIITTNASSFC